jgi:transcriptional regulator with XRE-family HTH domain
MESVRRMRREKGLSQQELAELAGVGQDSISAIETGKHEPHPRTLRKLAKALDVEVADFFKEPVPLAKAPGEAGLPEEERRADHVYRFDHDDERFTVEYLQSLGIKANNSEVGVLNQYLQLHERPPTGIVAIGHVAKEGEPVDHDKVRGILLWLLAKGLVPPKQAEAVAENVRAELVGVSNS